MKRILENIHVIAIVAALIPGAYFTYKGFQGREERIAAYERRVISVPSPTASPERSSEVKSEVKSAVKEASVVTDATNDKRAEAFASSIGLEACESKQGESRKAPSKGEGNEAERPKNPFITCTSILSAATFGASYKTFKQTNRARAQPYSLYKRSKSMLRDHSLSVRASRKGGYQLVRLARNRALGPLSSVAMVVSGGAFIVEGVKVRLQIKEIEEAETKKKFESDDVFDDLLNELPTPIPID